ncbi:YraN family protein [Fluviicola sp.]|uniref:YraN family protein n=1 Tax=Fluviicola sp. TaxID=1917219 RepID=UPI0031DF0CAC
MTDQELGMFGEQMAQRFLLKNGYTIRKTNYRYLKFEIDIIAEKNDQIVVVEVKTRQTAEIGEPWMAVTKKKQRQIILCADHYVQSGNLSQEVRFDIISIVHNQYRTKLEHIEDAFST